MEEEKEEEEEEKKEEVFPLLSKCLQQLGPG